MTFCTFLWCDRDYGYINHHIKGILCASAPFPPHLLIYSRLCASPPPFGCLLGFEQAVRGVDNLLLTLSLNKVWACCHKDSGGQREAGFCAQP